jgi:hypothetical protein
MAKKTLPNFAFEVSYGRLDHRQDVNSPPARQKIGSA